MEYIGWLDDPEQDPTALGGKGAGLAILARAGFRIPLGFCVRAPAYAEYIEENDLRRVIREVLATPNLHVPRIARQACAPLTTRVAATRLPDALGRAIGDAYRQLRTMAGPQLIVAARSSALSEDRAGASAAGVYETYLNLRDESALLEAVLRCYRSLWAPRAVQYRAFKHIDGAREAMAVVVMQMIAADVSGVAFTINPLTADRSQMLINASWGLGESVVSGRVTPDQFVVDKGTLAVLERDVARKAVEIVPDPTGASGTILVDVPDPRARRPALNDERLRELGDTCVGIERHFGRPMDIEWALHDGELFILQARPVTGAT